MTFEGQSCIRLRHTATVVYHLDRRATSINHQHLDVLRASIDSVLKHNTPKYLKDLSQKELARRDSLLRGTVISEEKFSLSGATERVLPIEGMHFFTPLRGTVSQGFDMVLHPALDITAPANSVVSSVLDGTIIFAGWTDETGYTLQILHPGNLISSYKHNQKLLRKAGDKVFAQLDKKYLAQAWSRQNAFCPSIRRCLTTLPKREKSSWLQVG